MNRRSMRQGPGMSVAPVDRTTHTPGIHSYSFMEGLVLKTSKKEKVLTEDNNQLFFEALSFCSLSFILSILWSIYFHPTFRPSLLPIHKTRTELIKNYDV